MPGLVRVTAFVLILAAVFVAAAAIGRAVGPLERDVDNREDGTRMGMVGG